MQIVKPVESCKSCKVGPEDVMGKLVPILIDAARQGTKKYVVDGKKFAPSLVLPNFS